MYEGMIDQQSQGNFISQFLRSHHVNMKVTVFGLSCAWIMKRILEHGYQIF